MKRIYSYIFHPDRNKARMKKWLNSHMQARWSMWTIYGDGEKQIVLTSLEDAKLFRTTVGRDGGRKGRTIQLSNPPADLPFVYELVGQPELYELVDGD